MAGQSCLGPAQPKSGIRKPPLRPAPKGVAAVGGGRGRRGRGGTEAPGCEQGVEGPRRLPRRVRPPGRFRLKDRPLDPGAVAPPPPWAIGLRFRGLEQLRQRLQGGAPLLASTSSAPLSGRLWIAQLGAFGLTGGTLDAPAFCSGFCPPDVLSATLVLAAPEGGSINGAPLEEGGLLLFPPGGVYEGWSPAGYRWVTAFLPRVEAQRLVEGAGVALPRLDGASVLRSRVPRADLVALRQGIESLALERPRSAPSSLPAEGAQALAGTWRRILTYGWAHGAPVASGAARRRSEDLLRAADRYLREHLGSPVYLTDLARATGTPARTLEHAFRRRLGLTPMAYLTWLRMAAARRRLTDRHRTAASAVTEAAHEVGFPHLGRFAVTYRRTFGESPSATVLTYAGRRRAAASTAHAMGPTFDPAIVEPAGAAS